jgi:hypothetical protein
MSLALQVTGLSLQDQFTVLNTPHQCVDDDALLPPDSHPNSSCAVFPWTCAVQVTGLSLQDQFTLLNAPIDVYDDIQRSAFIDFARTYAAGQPVLFNEALIPDGPPKTELHMEQAENLHKVCGSV